MVKKENTGPKIRREFQTVSYMMDLYYKKFPEEISKEELEDLRQYAKKRLSFCPFGEDKPTCKACTIHCYQKKYQDKMQKIMRYAGPRMLFHHPILAIDHLRKEIKSIKKEKKQ